MTASLALGPTPDVALSRVNPVAQLSALVVVTVVLLTSLDVVTPTVVVAVELALLPAAGLTSPRALWLRTWPLLVGAGSVGLVNLVLGSSGTLSALGLALRVVGLALPGVLLVASTDPVRLADALTEHWKLPARFAVGALAALRLVPLLVTEFESVRLARRTRGVQARTPVARIRMLAGIGFTLLVGAVRRASRLATAMDARGFDSGLPRTNARGSVLRPSDLGYVAGTVGVCALAVTASVLAGTWDPVFVGG